MSENEQLSDDRVPTRLAVPTYCGVSLVSLAAAVAVIWKHGFSQPFSLAIAFVIVLLSLTWLGVALKSSLPTRRQFQTHISLFLMLTAVDRVIAFFR